MVTINLTMLVELILFLIFLWGTQRFILTPVLNSMDERNDSIERDIEKAKDDDIQSDELELKYRHEIAVIRRNADEELRAVKQKAMREHSDFLQQERINAETAVEEVRVKAMAMMESEREAVLAEVPELARLMEAQLTASARLSNNGGSY
jgi:F-type H+-transporting ATPase subunit b